MTGSREAELLAELRLDGRVALVTGAARGIGRAIALTLAENGAKVSAIDINLEGARKVVEEIREKGGIGIAVKADVKDKEQVKRLVEEVLEKFGTIDILVNNAGILKPTKVEDIEEDEWDRIIDVNLKGTFLCSKAVIKVMKDKKSGKIINISSAAGRSHSTFGGAHYTASKAGVLGLTRHLAKELAPYNVNVNAVCPGNIDTAMIREHATPEFIKSVISRIPMGRLGRPEEVANVVLFLASDLSSYITGASIDLNAGTLMI